MWNLLSRNNSKTKSSTDITVSCVALHEQASGDVRSIVYSTDGSELSGLHYIGLQSGAGEYRSADYEFIVRHILDSQYSYGVLYSLIPDNQACYEDMQTKGVDGHALLRVSPIGGGHVSWVGVDSGAVIQSERSKPDQVIGNGYAGIHKLFGLPSRTVFMYIIVERYESRVVLMMDSHVLGLSTIPVGTSQLVRTVADTLACPTDMARTIVETHGVLDTHYDARLKNRIIATIEPLLNSVEGLANLYETARYKPEFMRYPLSGWVFGGTGSSVPGLSSLISTLVGMMQYDDIAKPYQKLIKELSSGPNKSIIPRYYTALGLAISGA